jgi:hypothetical protein
MPETRYPWKRPKVIETDEQYEGAAARLAELVCKGQRRTPGESRLMRLLAVPDEGYDRRHALPPGKNTPDERLKYLLETSGRTLPTYSGCSASGVSWTKHSTESARSARSRPGR